MCQNAFAFALPGITLLGKNVYNHAKLQKTRLNPTQNEHERSWILLSQAKNNTPQRVTWQNAQNVFAVSLPAFTLLDEHVSKSSKIIR